MKIAPMIFIDDIFIANKQKYLQMYIPHNPESTE